MARTKQIAALLLLIAGASVSVKAAERTKTFAKRFEITNDAQVRLDTRYGKLRIETWDSSAVSFHAFVQVEAPTDKRADERINAVTVEFEQNGKEVLMRTDIQPERIRWFSFNVSGSTSINITYTVKMPKHLAIEIAHSYGDILFREFTGLVSINLKYGNLRADALPRGENAVLNRLALSYAKADIAQVGWLNVEAKYSHLTLKKATALAIESRYTDISLGEVGSLAFDSKYDGYKLKQVDKMTGKGSYTDMSVSRLQRFVEADFSYGDFEVDYVAPQFELVKVKSTYTDLEVCIDETANYTLKAKTVYGDISLRGINLRSTNDFDDDDRRYVEGEVGHKPFFGKVVLSSSYGDIQVSQR